MSPTSSASGMQSPTFSGGKNSFVFPMRSVFNGIAPSETQPSTPGEARSGEHGDHGQQGHPLHRVSSGGSPGPGSLSPSWNEARRFSVDHGEAAKDWDGGMETIAQMLQQGQDGYMPMDGKGKGKGVTSVATFNRRGNRSASIATVGAADGSGSTSPRGRSLADTSLYSGSVSSGGDGSRRASAEDEAEAQVASQEKAQDDERPELATHDSGGTVKKASGDGPVGPAPAPASSLPSTDAPTPTPSAPTPPSPHSRPPQSPDHKQEIRRPIARHIGHAGHVDPSHPTLDSNTAPSPSHPEGPLTATNPLPQPTQPPGASRGSRTDLDLDERGRQSLLADITGIVHLGSAGSFASAAGGTGTATGTNEKRTGTAVSSRAETQDSSRQEGETRSPAKPDRSASSAPVEWPSPQVKVGASTGTSRGTTSAKLAQQQRQVGKRDARQQSVRAFVDSQAGVENMGDPNAPTPSPAPVDGRVVETDEAGDELVQGMKDLVAEFGMKSDESDPPGEHNQQPGEKREGTGTGTGTGTGGSSQAETSENTPTPGVDGEPITTFRFEHVATDDGHHIVVGREGELKRCEDEPITTPGAVQGFGVLMVLQEDYETGYLSVRQVSENCTDILGLSPKYLFQLDCFTQVLPHDQDDILRDNLEYLPMVESGRNGLEDDGPSVFLLSGYGEPGSEETEEDQSEASARGSTVVGESATLSGSSAGTQRRREWSCWVGAHRPEYRNWEKVDDAGNPIPQPDLIILEFELQRDAHNPLMQPWETPETQSAGRSTPESGSLAGVRSEGSVSHDAGEDTPRGGVSAAAVEAVAAAGAGRRTAGSDGSETTASLTTLGRPARPTASHKTSFTSYPSSGGTTANDERMGLEGLDAEVPLDRILESTTNHAKPLRALERMRGSGGNSAHPDSQGRARGRGSSARGGRRRTGANRGASGTMDIFAVLGQINEQLGAAPDLETFLKITVGVVQDLCRFHRVLIYQFDEAMNGNVVSELVEWGKTTDLYKGLRFPAADIPAQARELYKINKVRMLYDRSQTTARIVVRNKEDLETPLDMTHCYLRAMSPIHIKYLANMGVRSSMSVSILAFGQLWGLIACHSYGHHGMRVSFPVRQMLRILSDTISRNIERLSYAQRLHTRKLISTIPTQAHPTGYIVSNADDLLQIFDAEAGLLVIGDGCKLLGQNRQGQTMLAIAEYLRIMAYDTLKASSCLREDFPDLTLPRAPDTIAGLLYVPLTARAGQDFMVFLRNGQVRQVQWAGKPYKDEQAGAAASLEPRKSFATWSEIVTGHSKRWTDDQLESAGVLALIYGKFIQVWREKQNAMASNQLTAILLSNTSHAVRTPLSQIINTLELALAGDIDADVRKMLENSHQASRALLFHVHDLLDLTRIETGNETAFNDPFDIRQSISDAVRLYQTELARRGLEFRLNMADNLPKYLIGDARKIKTVISNLVANSVKFTEKGFIEVYCGVQSREGGVSSIASGASISSMEPAVERGGMVSIEIAVSDSGCGIPPEKLEEMFVTLEGAEESQEHRTGLGLGLAVVARIAEQLEGQLRAESEVDVGTRFYFNLQMVAHNGDTLSKSSRRSSDQSIKRFPHTRTRSTGSGSVVSLVSDGSGVQSGVPEIQSFVNDFQESHMARKPTSPDDPRLREADERMNRPGTFPVTDSSWPVRPISVATDALPPSMSASPRLGTSPRLPTSKKMTGVEMPAKSKRPEKKVSSPRKSVDAGSKSQLKVMVVEDDMINAQILCKRLKMDKHLVTAVTNGQECVDALQKDWDFDAILMDIQMPIMDGKTATKTIRKLEAKGGLPTNLKALRVDGRIPVFAVSASLYESDRLELEQDFDGWLLKPLDFARVRALLSALVHPEERPQQVYVQGCWEKGGYFKGGPSPSSSATASPDPPSTSSME
ncbi:hypothetical protein IAT38_003100 [Cryptococcus sp. DSM 104549]